VAALCGPRPSSGGNNGGRHQREGARNCGKSNHLIESPNIWIVRFLCDYSRLPSQRSIGRRGPVNLVVRVEVLASESDELVLARMVDHFVTDDANRGLRPVLVRVVTKVGSRGVRAGHEDLGDAVERIANLSEELVLSPYCTAVLRGVVGMRTDLLLQYLVGVELQDLRGLVIGPDHGVEKAHVKVPFAKRLAYDRARPSRTGRRSAVR
jgi:hypothetical protein